MGQRREPRVRNVLPVRVWGFDSSGNRFMIDTQTIDISQTGARLEGVWPVKGPGFTIEVRHGNEKGRFLVICVGKAGTPQAGHIGIRSLESEKSIWETTLPAPEPDGYQRVQPKPSSSPTESERRKHPRYQCMGEARILPKGSELWVHGVLPISLSGCYVEMMSPLPPQTHIELALTVEELVVHTSGLVKVSFQGMGIGVAFTEIASQDQELLERMVGRAAGTLGTEPVLEPTPQAMSEPSREIHWGATSIPTVSDTEAVLETLLKLLARKTILSREEFLELMSKLKSLDR